MADPFLIDFTYRISRINPNEIRTINPLIKARMEYNTALATSIAAIILQIRPPQILAVIVFVLGIHRQPLAVIL